MIKSKDIVKPLEGVTKTKYEVDISNVIKAKVLRTYGTTEATIKVIEGYIFYNGKKYIDNSYEWTVWTKDIVLYIEGDEDYEFF